LGKRRRKIRPPVMPKKKGSSKSPKEPSQVLREIPARVILDAIPEVVIVIDLDFRIIEANRSFERAFGLPRSEVIGRTCYEVSHAQPKKCAPPAHLCPVDQLLETRQPMVTMHTHYDEAGNKQYVELSAGPILDDRGEVVAIVEVVRDVTHRISAKGALKKSIEDLERISADLTDYLER
jgi:PAS domain S-box-containing protein